MGTLNERLLLIIDAKSGGAVKEFRKVSGEADKAAAQVEKVGGTASKFSSAQIAGLATAAAIAIPAAVGYLKSATIAASDLNEQTERSRRTFGASAQDVEAFANTAASSLGLARSEALEAASSFGSFARAAGLSDKASASLSIGLTQLAGDLASFRNTSVGDAVQAISSGLSGESEPLRRYAIDIREATVNQEALKLGLAKSNSEITQQDKVLARISTIFKQSTLAQGDYARTADGLANTLRTLRAENLDLSATIGQVTAPALAITAGSFATLANVGRKAGESTGLLGKALEFTAKVSPIAQLASLTDAITGGNDPAEKAAEAYKGAGEAVRKFGKDSPQAKAAIDSLGKTIKDAVLDTKALADVSVGLGDTFKTEEERAATLTSAIRANITAQRGLQDAQAAQAAAVRRVAEIEKDRAALVAKGPVDLAKVADAETALAKARQDEADAAQTVRDRQADLDTLRATGSIKVARDLARAELSIRSSALDVLDAQDRLVASQKALDDARNGSDALTQQEAQVSLLEAQQRLANLQGAASKGQSTSDTAVEIARAQLEVAKAEAEVAKTRGLGSDRASEIAAAERDVERARLNVEQTSLDQKDAEANLATARQGGAKLAADIAGGERDVLRARDDLKARTADVTKAEGDLRTARAGDPEFAAKLAKFDQDLAEARRGVVRATEDVGLKSLDAADGVDTLTTALDGNADVLARSVGPLRDVVAGYSALAGLLGVGNGGVGADGIPNLLRAPAPRNVTQGSGNLRRRAVGGPTAAGTPYLVGEHGPEVFIPSTRGSVTPTGFASSSTGAQVIQVVLDGRVVAESVTRHQQQSERQGGRFR